MTKKGQKLSKSDGDNGEKLVDFKFKYLKASSVKNPDILKQFIIWRSLYKQFRNPHTQNEFAKQHGIGINTLTRWTFLEGFWKEVDCIRGIHWRKYTNGVLWHLKKRATSTGDSRDIKLWLQYIEGFMEKPGVVHKETDDELTSEEKAELERSYRFNDFTPEQIKRLISN